MIIISIEEKMEKIVRNLSWFKVNFEEKAQTQIREIVKNGWDKLPICMAKTQYSFSTILLLLEHQKISSTIRELVPKLDGSFIVKTDRRCR